MAKKIRPQDQDSSPVHGEDESTTPTSSTPPSPTSPVKPTVVKSQAKRIMPVWAWIVVAVVVLGGLALIGWMVAGRHPASTGTTNTPANTNTAAQLVPRVLDGVPVPADQ